MTMQMVNGFHNNNTNIMKGNRYMLTNNNKIEPNTVYTFKLISGEELIGKTAAVVDDSDSLTLLSPRAVYITEQGCSVGPWLHTVSPDSDIVIQKSAIAAKAKTEKDYATQYEKHTSIIEQINPGSGNIIT